MYWRVSDTAWAAARISGGVDEVDMIVLNAVVSTMMALLR